MSAQIALHDTNMAEGRWLSPLRDAWPVEVIHHLADQPSVVRVVLAAKRGSAPRDAGTIMLVTPRDITGTIGGGHLEWEAIRAARNMIEDAQSRQIHVQRMILGQELAQCCGGAVHLWLERFTRDDLSWLRRLSHLTKDHDAPLLATHCTTNDIKRQLLRPGMSQYPSGNFPYGIQFATNDAGSMLIERLNTRRMTLWLYGAGHVGQALVRLLVDLPIDITWIDTRADLLPSDLPKNVRVKITHAPLELARSAPAAAHHRVLTHDHSLDYALCRELLDGDFASLGVIGSSSKAAKFRAQLKRDGVPPERVAALLCPIGIPMPSKEPTAIAIGIAAQLLQLQSDLDATFRNMRIEAPSADAELDPPFLDTCNDAACATCHANRATSLATRRATT